MKSTKKTLLLSMMSMLLCVAMLMGTTFAWFTDKVESGVNTITAGNLDIDVQFTKDNGANWADLEGSDSVFSSNLWEPGHTEYVTLKITNKGTLALKYRMNVTPINEKGGINVNGESFKLSDYLVFGTTTPAETFTTYTRDTARNAAGATKGLNQLALTQNSTLLPKADGAIEYPTQYITLVVYMPETVGNEANYKTGTTAPEIELGIKFIATQYQYETDSFGNDYDKDDNIAEDGNEGEKALYPAIDTIIAYNYFPQVSYVAQLKKADTKAVKDGDDANVYETATQITVQSEEKVAANKPYVKATFNNTDVETYDANDKAAVELKAKKVAEGNIVIDEQEKETVTYDVSVVATTGAMKDNTLFTVDLFVGEGKQNVSVTHKGTPDVVMTKVDELGSTPDTFVYNASTGYVTMLVDHFSEFVATYNAPVAAVETKAYYSLAEAAKNAQDKTIVMIRDTTEKDIDLSEKTLDLNGKNVKLEGEVTLPDGLTQDENGNVIEGITEKHIYVYVSNGDGTHTGTCECGKTTDAEACDFTGWNHDETQHWHACKVCQADSNGERKNHTWSLDYDNTDSSNHCTTCGRFRWTAEIGNVGYETLKEAIAADFETSKVDGYKGTLITMLNNEDITVNQYATVQAGQKITLNLNGCVIKQNATGLNSSSKIEQTHVIVNKGTLIINDSSKNKTGKIYSYSANADWGAGHYTIDNASGTLTINGGTFHNKVGTSGLCMNLHTGAYGASPVTTINGGTFIGGYSTVLYNNNSGAPTLNINGGTFKGTVYLQFASSNTTPGMILNISGGTFDNHTMSGCILVAGQPDTVGVDGSDLEISITGGNFIVGDDYYETGCVLNCNAGTVSDVDDGYISGGYFNFNVNKRELVAGKYTVPNTDVSTNDVYYFTVGNASYKVSHTVSQYVLVGSLDNIEAEIAAGTQLFIDFPGLYGEEYNNVLNRYLDITDDTISANNWGSDYTGKHIYETYCKRGVYNDAGYAGRCVCKIQDVTYDFYFADSDSADAFIATYPSIVFTKTTTK